MLDAISLSLLAALDRDQSEMRVRALFEARKQGDLDRVLAAMSPNIIYVIVGSQNPYPRSGRREGIDAARAILREFHINFETLACAVHSIQIEGERALVRQTVTLRHRGTSEIGDVRVINCLRFREGVLTEFFEYSDMKMIVRLMGEPEVDACSGDSCTCGVHG